MRNNPFYQLPAGAMVTGPTESLIEAFFPLQHHSHVQQYRWHLHTRDDDKRMEAVRAEMALIIAERRARA